MKRYFFAAAAATLSLAAFAQSYQVTVTTQDGTKHTYTTGDVTNMKFVDNPDYLTATTYGSGIYNRRGNSGEYYFVVGSGATDATGDPLNVGDFKFQLSLVGDPSEEAHNAIIPDTYYSSQIADPKHYYDMNKSAMWIRTEDGVERILFLDGIVDVKYDEGTYKLKAEMTSLDGLTVAVRYEGPMKFSVGQNATVDFNEDQNVTFTGSTGRYWGNWYLPFADDFALNLYTGTYTGGTDDRGFMLRVEGFQPKVDDLTGAWQPVLADGTYVIDKRDKVNDNTYLPFSFTPGKIVEFWGEQYVSGTYLQYIAENGSTQRALVIDGTMTVSNGGKHIVLDMTGENNIRIQGEYDGLTGIGNYVDNSNAPTDFCHIDSDITLDFPGKAVALDYNLGDYIIEGINAHLVMFTDPAMKTGDYLALEVLCEGEQLANGVYTINNALENYSGIKGMIDFGGNTVFSWYGDLDSADSEGYQTVLGPVWGGTMTVTGEGSNRVFTFDLTASNGKKITGTYTGLLNHASEQESVRARQHQRIPAMKIRVVRK